MSPKMENKIIMSIVSVVFAMQSVTAAVPIRGSSDSGMLAKESYFTGVDTHGGGALRQAAVAELREDGINGNLEAVERLIGIVKFGAVSMDRAAAAKALLSMTENFPAESGITSRIQSAFSGMGYGSMSYKKVLSAYIVVDKRRWNELELGASVMPVLSAILDSNDLEDIENAVRKIGEIGGVIGKAGISAVVSDLEYALDKDSTEVRLAVLDAFENIFKRDDRDNSRNAILSILGEHLTHPSPAAKNPEWLRRVWGRRAGNKDTRVYRKMIGILGAFGGVPEAKELWKIWQNDDDITVRLDAAKALLLILERPEIQKEIKESHKRFFGADYLDEIRKYISKNELGKAEGMQALSVPAGPVYYAQEWQKGDAIGVDKIVSGISDYEEFEHEGFVFRLDKDFLEMMIGLGFNLGGIIKDIIINFDTVREYLADRTFSMSHRTITVVLADKGPNVGGNCNSDGVILVNRYYEEIAKRLKQGHWYLPGALLKLLFIHEFMHELGGKDIKSEDYVDGATTLLFNKPGDISRVLGIILVNLLNEMGILDKNTYYYRQITGVKDVELDLLIPKMDSVLDGVLGKGVYYPTQAKYQKEMVQLVTAMYGAIYYLGRAHELRNETQIRFMNFICADVADGEAEKYIIYETERTRDPTFYVRHIANLIAHNRLEDAMRLIRDNPLGIESEELLIVVIHALENLVRQLVESDIVLVYTLTEILLNLGAGHLEGKNRNEVVSRLTKLLTWINALMGPKERFYRELLAKKDRGDLDLLMAELEGFAIDFPGAKLRNSRKDEDIQYLRAVDAVEKDIKTLIPDINIEKKTMVIADIKYLLPEFHLIDGGIEFSHNPGLSALVKALNGAPNINFGFTVSPSDRKMAEEILQTTGLLGRQIHLLDENNDFLKMQTEAREIVKDMELNHIVFLVKPQMIEVIQRDKEVQGRIGRNQLKVIGVEPGSVFHRTMLFALAYSQVSKIFINGYTLTKEAELLLDRLTAYGIPIEEVNELKKDLKNSLFFTVKITRFAEELENFGKYRLYIESAA